MPEPIAFEIEAAKKTREGLDLEVHVLAEIVPGRGLVKRGYVKPNIPGFGAFELYCDADHPLALYRAHQSRNVLSLC